MIKHCKTPSDCQREDICLDAWHCSSIFPEFNVNVPMPTIKVNLCEKQIEIDLAWGQYAKENKLYYPGIDTEVLYAKKEIFYAGYEAALKSMQNG